jgi:hypothetical protein
MVLLIQFEKPSAQEKAALKGGFKRYAYYEHNAGDVPLACWVFQYPAPVRFIDAPFHAGLYQDGRIEKLLAGAANALTVYVLDGPKLAAMRYCGLQPATMQLFRATIVKQLSRPITRAHYDAAIEDLYRMSSAEIFQRGSYFAHKELQP